MMNGIYFDDADKVKLFMIEKYGYSELTGLVCGDTLRLEYRDKVFALNNSISIRKASKSIKESFE